MVMSHCRLGVNDLKCEDCFHTAHTLKKIDDIYPMGSKGATPVASTRHLPSNS